MVGEMRLGAKNASKMRTCKIQGTLLVAMISLNGCIGTEEKSISDADWITDQPLYEGDDKSLFVNSEFHDKKRKGKNDDPTKDEYVKSGDKAWSSGEPEKAMYDYLRALKLDDQDQSIYFKIGIIHEYGGNVKLAELAYAKAIEIDPTYLEALERRGTMLLKQRKYAQAKGAFREVIALDEVRVRKLSLEVAATGSTNGAAGGTAPDQHSPLGVGTEKGDVSIPKFDNLSPFHAYNGLGVIEDLDGNHVAAYKLFDIARQIAPDLPFIYNNMGYSSYLANDLDMAESLFRKAVSMDSEYVAAWRNLALVHVRKEKYDDAIAVLASSVDDEASANNTVGYLCMLGKKHDLAEKYFNRAIELSPVYFSAANENIKKNNQLRSRESLAVKLP